MRNFKQGDTAWSIRKGEMVEVQILGTVNKTSYIGTFNDKFNTENSIFNIPAMFDEENLYKTIDEARLALLFLEGIGHE